MALPLSLAAEPSPDAYATAASAIPSPDAFQPDRKPVHRSSFPALFDTNQRRLCSVCGVRGPRRDRDYETAKEGLDMSESQSPNNQSPKETLLGMALGYMLARAV